MGSGVRISYRPPFFMTKELSLQETYSPQGTCFGCGPANSQGLKIRSFSEGDKIVAHWRAQPHHEAFPGMLNGGIIGALLDCHSNWTAAYSLMKTQGLDKPPCTVTAEFSVKLHRPTPSAEEIVLEAKPIEIQGDRVTTEAQLLVGGKICASCKGTFVAVKPGHPAYHRW